MLRAEDGSQGTANVARVRTNLGDAAMQLRKLCSFWVGLYLRVQSLRLQVPATAQCCTQGMLDRGGRLWSLLIGYEV